MKYDLIKLAKFFLFMSGRKNIKGLLFEIDEQNNYVVNIHKNNGYLFCFFYFNYPHMKGKPKFVLRKKRDGHNIIDILESDFLEYSDFIVTNNHKIEELQSKINAWDLLARNNPNNIHELSTSERQDWVDEINDLTLNF